MSETLADATIVQGLRQGNQQAWDALCQHFSSRLWKTIARLIGGDEEAVADVFQETLLAVAKAGRTITIETRLWPWLAAIAHNQAALYWRKTYRSRRVWALEAGFNEFSEDNPIDRLLQSETVDLVRSLLAEMSPDAVSLLLGKYLDGFSVLELSQLLGGTEESIRSRLARARRDFRSRYERAIKSQDSAGRVPAKELSPREGDLT